MSETVGNAAAMREALLEIETVAGEAVENGTMELPQYSKIVDIAESALSAPARNCDVYDSYGDAIRAFEDSENAEDYEEMAEWLYAPAEERKGEGS